MEKLFLTVLNMSVTASAVIILVLLVRRALRGAPKVFSYSLWSIVLLRLLCPVTITSRFSIISNYSELLQTLSRIIGYIPVPQTKMGNTIGSIVSEAGRSAGLVLPQGQDSSIIPAPLNWTLIVSVLWLAGVAVMLGYSIWSMVKFRRNLAASVRLEGSCDVRLADHIPSPFVWGLFSPQIYLPSDLPESELDYILLHERTHIRRKDHIFRALAWLALMVHWFNPLVWLAFSLAGRDMEMSCDEAVLKEMGWWAIRRDYTTTLLRISAGGKLPAGPLAFGGGDLKRRIQNILAYRTPGRAGIIAALVIVLLAGTALATDPTRIIAPSGVASVAASMDYRASREDILGTPDLYTLAEEDGRELVHLINSHRKSVHIEGDNISAPACDDWVRINCAGGGFYILHYWYWNSFSLNPLHMGEDDYTTLVTYYDAEGSAGTTWQMEYSFDYAFADWRAHAVFPLRRLA